MYDDILSSLMHSFDLPMLQWVRLGGLACDDLISFGV